MWIQILKSLVVWLCFVPVAILNGGLRQYVLDKVLGEWALPVSGALLSIFIFLITWALLPRLGEMRKMGAYIIACLWTGLTVLFEFAFGMMEGKTLGELLPAYNPLTGNLWLLVVLVTAVSPIIVCRRNKPEVNG